MKTGARRRRLRADLADARHAFGGPLAPRIPYSERTRIRLHAEALYRSDAGQRLRGGVGDLVDRLRGGGDPDLPPHRLQLAVGGGDFRAIGEEFRRHFVELGGLHPEHDVLDVGSGSGRMAYALTGWLTGRYEGFDVMPDAVAWCRLAITTRHPTFRFQLADIRSLRYNAGGRYAVEDFRFPYDDDSFDFAFVTSVFTHLRKPAVENYVSELARVLRPGGRCLTTYYLMNDEAVGLMGGHGQFGFDQGDQLVVDDEVPERTVAFHEHDVRELHGRHALPFESVHYGSWCGRRDYTSFQDIAVSVRRGAG